MMKVMLIKSIKRMCVTAMADLVIVINILMVIAVVMLMVVLAVVLNRRGKVTV